VLVPHPEPLDLPDRSLDVMSAVTPCHVPQTVTSDVPSTLTCYTAGDAGQVASPLPEARALEPTRRCPSVAAVSSSPDDNPLRAAACASSSRAVKLRAGIPASLAISSAQLEAMYVRSEDPQQVRGERFRPCTR